MPGHSLRKVRDGVLRLSLPLICTLVCAYDRQLEAFSQGFTLQSDSLLASAPLAVSTRNAPGPLFELLPSSQTGIDLVQEFPYSPPVRLPKPGCSLEPFPAGHVIFISSN